QLFVFTTLVSQLIKVPGLDYFRFFSMGTLNSTRTSIARIRVPDLIEEEELGLLDYLLSLPFGRSLFVLGRALGGALRGLVYVFPMLLLVALLNGYFSVSGILGALLVLFVLATGISGLSITLAMLIRNENRFDIVIALAELGMVRVSATIYPLQFMPRVVQPIASYSLATSASDLVRTIIPRSSSSVLEPLPLLLFVGVFFVL